MLRRTATRRILAAAALLGAAALAPAPASAQMARYCDDTLQVNAVWASWNNSGQVVAYMASITNQSPQNRQVQIEFNFHQGVMERVPSPQSFTGWGTQQLTLARIQPGSSQLSGPEILSHLRIRCM